MNIFIESIKTIISFCVLSLLPGVFFTYFMRRASHLSRGDILDSIPLYFIFSLLLWIPLSTISYSLHLNRNYVVYILAGILLIFLAIMIFDKKSHSPKLNLSYFAPLFSVYTLWICILAAIVGYISQFQTGDSDAFAHLASIRNISLAKNITSCDWILGNNAPIASTYGCSVWYLILGITASALDVDAALAYPAICGVLFFLSVISFYGLLKEISGDIFISKIASCLLVICFVGNWMLIIGSQKYYSLDPLNNLIFPQHLITYILFPISCLFIIRYLRHYRNSDLIFLLSSIVVISRIHPAWLFWIPILLLGILFFNTLFNEKNFYKWTNFFKLIFLIFICSFISLIGYVYCVNTFSSDVSIIAPLALWRSSGGNLLFLSNYLYFYDPRSYFSERMVFDVGALFFLYHMSKPFSFDDLSNDSNHKVKTFKLLFWSYVGTLASVSVIVFNPLATYLTVTYLKTSVVLYRSFSLVTPFLSCITIYAVLSYLQLKMSQKFFRISTLILLIFSSVGMICWRYEYFDALYQNKGGYYSTYHSIADAPFSFFRTVTPGNIVIDTPMATAVAALTALDPITTEVWRAKSTEDIAFNKKDNDELLKFNTSISNLREIIVRRNIKYVYLSKNNSLGLQNIRKFPELVHLRSVLDESELWEVNEGLK